MKVITTPSELIGRLKWEQACDMLGYHPWAVDEGLMDADQAITLTQVQATKLGLLPRAETETAL